MLETMRANATHAIAIPAMAPGDRCAVVVRGVLSTLIGDRRVAVVGFVLSPGPLSVVVLLLLWPSSVGKPWPGMTMKSDIFAAALWMSSDTEEFCSFGRGLGFANILIRVVCEERK